MTTKNIFDDDEANAYFRRNRKKSGEKQTDKPVSLLCDWLMPFKDDITEILDIGCGNGHKLNQLSEVINAPGYGVEPSTEAVQYISNHFPLLTVRVGYADNIPFSRDFSLVHLGFFLYLIERKKYLRCVSEVDRLVKVGGFLSIIDFETPYPYSKKYAYKDGIYSHKQNNSDVFIASNLYSVVNKYHFSHENFFFDKEINERVSLTLLYKESKIFDGS